MKANTWYMWSDIFIIKTSQLYCLQLAYGIFLTEHFVRR